MNGLIIFPESEEELNMHAVTVCQYCIWYSKEWQYCKWWHHRTDANGWCYKNEEEDTDDVYSEED